MTRVKAKDPWKLTFQTDKLKIHFPRDANRAEALREAITELVSLVRGER